MTLTEPAISNAVESDLTLAAPSLGAEAAPADHEGRIIALTSAGHTLCHMAELVFAGALLGIKSEFALEPEQVTLVGLGGFALFGLGALPAGLATDRWGARRVLIVYFLWLALAVGAVALSSDVWELAAALTALGAAISLYHPAGLALITHGCRKRGRALGINGVAGNVGIAGGPALGLLFAQLGHWRFAYLFIAGAALLGFLAMLLLPIDETPVCREARPEAPADAKHLRPGVWLLFAAMFLGGLNYRCLMTALPTYLSGDAGGHALEQGSVLVFLVLLLGGVGQYVSGHYADRLVPTRLYVGLIATTAPLALLLAHVDATVAAVVAATLAIFMFGQQPVENTILAHATPPRRRSTFFGLKFVLTFGVGALGTQLVGVIWQHTGSLAPVFDVFAAGAVLMASFAALFGRTLRA